MLWPSSELSRQDGSDEGSEFMVSMRNKKIIPQIASNTPSYLELLNSVGHDQTAPLCPNTYKFLW